MNRKKLLSLLSALTMFMPFIASSSAGVFPASDESIHYGGRHVVNGDSVTIGYPGVEILVDFTGNSIAIAGEIHGESSHYNVYVDELALPRVDLASGPFSIMIAQGLDKNKTHQLRLVRRSEAWIGVTRFDSFSVSENATLVAAKPTAERKMLCIGDSITCGEKADLIGDYIEIDSKAWNAERSYGSFLAKRFNAELNLVSYGGKGLVRDWEGKTSTVTAPQFFERPLPDADLKWDHASYSPDLVTICLGTNDFSSGIVAEEVFVSAYTKFVERIHEVHPEAKVLLVSGPWFADGDPKKDALNRYILMTIENVNSKGDAYAYHHFFDTTYPGTPRDAHPIAPQHQAMADHIAVTISNWLGW